MKAKYLISLLFLLNLVYSQRNEERELRDYINPEELVTLSETIPFDQAIEVLSKISEKFTGKRIVSTAGVTDPIGIEINKMPYYKVLYIIVQYKDLIMEEKEEVIIVKKKGDTKAQLAEDIYASVDTREVKISALIFEMKTSEARERGINWQVLLSQSGLDVGFELLTTSEQQDDESSGSESEGATTDFNTTSASEFELGGFTGSATSLFRFFESENLGEVIASPSVTVRDKQQGRIQIGEDLSIKQRDIAGNVIDVFISTGTIIEVTPYIYNEDGINYILLKLKVERSSGTPDDVSTRIQKTQAESEVLMLDGEQTIIGGLFVNDETFVRRGIPFLKDLPWWVFGIRYLTGYEETVVEKSEVIILIETEIIPTLKERIAIKKEKNLIKEKLDQDDRMILKYKIDKLIKQEENNEEEKKEGD
ncbi:MAG: hypothetical protein PVH88_12095 [Ignavibacteria bacterium]|jgi:type IV pilus assembly protein PilQ